MMNNIYDTANQLEREFRQHPAFELFKESHQNIQENPDSKALFDEFRELSMQVQQMQMAGEELSPEAIEELQGLSQRVMEDQNINRLLQAEQQLSTIMNDLNEIITKPLNEIYQNI